MVTVCFNFGLEPNTDLNSHHLILQDTLRGGCEWSDAAICQIIALGLYFSAAIFSRCMPSPNERASERRVDTADAKASTSEAEVTRLQQELDQQKQRVQELEEENERTKNELAAATAAMMDAAAPREAPSEGLNESYNDGDLNC